MSNVPKTYADEKLKQYGTEYVNDKARMLFIEKMDDYADELSEEIHKALTVRRGKKILPKDVKLASQYI